MVAKYVVVKVWDSLAATVWASYERGKNDLVLDGGWRNIPIGGRRLGERESRLYGI
jgi:hypothetical protein